MQESKLGHITVSIDFTTGDAVVSSVNLTTLQMLDMAQIVTRYAQQRLAQEADDRLIKESNHVEARDVSISNPD